MAGIVAQLTKANWERKKNRGKHIPADKSVFNIPPYVSSTPKMGAHNLRDFADEYAFCRTKPSTPRNTTCT